MNDQLAGTLALDLMVGRMMLAFQNSNFAVSATIAARKSQLRSELKTRHERGIATNSDV